MLTMLKMRGRAAAGFVVALCVLLAGTAEAQDFSKVRIRAIPLTENVHLLAGAGGHILLLTGDEGALLVDCGFEETADKVLAATKGVRDVPLHYLINTHWHFDHAGGNEAMQAAGATIVAQENVRKCMAEERHLSHIDVTRPASPAGALPTITFEDTLTLHFAGECVRLTHVAPAHTNGDTFVYFEKANVLHIGDIGFMGQFPYIDVEAGGSVDGMIAGVDRALKMANEETKIVTGHGRPPIALDELRAYRQMLITSRDNVQKLIEAGKTREEIIAAEPMKELEAEWGRGSFGSKIWTEIVYDCLERADS